jgi:hypothetical protein
MGSRGLRAIPCRTVAGRRQRRGSLWPTQGLCDRCGPGCAGVGLVRPGRRHSAIDRGAGGAGCWRGFAGARKPCLDQRFISRGHTRQGDWHLVRLHGDDRGARACHWRLRHRALVVALRLPDQCPVRRCRARPGITLRSGEPESSRGRATRLAGCRACKRWAGRAGVWVDRILDIGLDGPAGACRTAGGGCVVGRFCAA